eukprot:sb/3476581/
MICFFKFSGTKISPQLSHFSAFVCAPFRKMVLLRKLIVKICEKSMGPNWDSRPFYKLWRTSNANAIWFGTWTLGLGFILTSYDPLKGDLPGDPKHYPDHSRPENFRKTRWEFQSL